MVWLMYSSGRWLSFGITRHGPGHAVRWGVPTVLGGWHAAWLVQTCGGPTAVPPLLLEERAPAALVFRQCSQQTSAACAWAAVQTGSGSGKCNGGGRSHLRAGCVAEERDRHLSSRIGQLAAWAWNKCAGHGLCLYQSKANVRTAPAGCAPVSGGRLCRGAMASGVERLWPRWGRVRLALDGGALTAAHTFCVLDACGWCKPVRHTGAVWGRSKAKWGGGGARAGASEAGLRARPIVFHDTWARALMAARTFLLSVVALILAAHTRRRRSRRHDARPRAAARPQLVALRGTAAVARLAFKPPPRPRTRAFCRAAPPRPRRWCTGHRAAR